MSKEDILDINKWLQSQENQMIKDIASLVSIKSISVKTQEPLEKPYGIECKEALSQMLELGAFYGFETDNCDNYCGSLKLGEGVREIGIWGHLDVVPVGEGWEYEPFSCTRKEDYLFGRGVADNKGPLVAVMYALRYLKESKIPLYAAFRLIFGCSEETGMEDAVYYLSTRRTPDFSLVADCNFPVCYGEKGICRLELESGLLSGRLCRIRGGTAANIVPVTADAKIKLERRYCIKKAYGLSGHAAFPESTKNAFYELCQELLKENLQDKRLLPKDKKIIRFIRDMSKDGYGKGIGIDYCDDLSGRLTCNLGVVCTENKRLKMQIDIRYPVTFTEEKIEEALSKLREKADAAGIAIQKVSNDPPYYMDKNHWLVGLLMEAYQEEVDLPEQKEAYIMGGGTYARKIPNAVGFGPGFPMDYHKCGLKPGHGGCHAADEVQSVNSLLRAVKIYVRAILKINEECKKENEKN